MKCPPTARNDRWLLSRGRAYLPADSKQPADLAVFVADPDFPVQIRPFGSRVSLIRTPSASSTPRSTASRRLVRWRSATEGGPGSEEHKFASDVEEIMFDWKPENVFVVEDMQNECVCYINSGYQLNSSGFWESEIFTFMLRSQTWCRFLITSSTEDRIISGASSIDGHMEFLAGGRLVGSVYGSRTFRFDTLSGESVPTSIAWQFTDAGEEQRPKKVKFPLLRAKLTNASFGLHGAQVGEDLDTELLEAGTNGSKTGSVTIENSSKVRIYPRTGHRGQ